jgi:hypothetical protein
MNDPAEEVVDEADVVDQHQPSPEDAAALAHYEQLQTKLWKKGHRNL